MPIYSLPPTNLTNGSTGVEQLLIYEAGQIDILIPSLLLFIYIIIAGSGFYASSRRTGTEKSLPLWLSISGFITTFLASLLFLYNGLVPITVLVIYGVVTFLTTLWLLLGGEM